jgi:hypothetical protein
MDPIAGLDAMEKTKFHLCRESKPDHAARSLVIILTELPQLLCFGMETSYMIYSSVVLE